MVFFKALKMQKMSKFPPKIQYLSIFALKKLNIQTSELYKTIYLLKVHLELSFNHICWALINYVNINFINLQNRTASEILEILQIQEASFQCAAIKRLWILFAIKCSYINSRKKNNSLDKGLLLSQNDSDKTEVWKALKSAQIFTVSAILNSSVRKSMKERGIRNEYIHTSKLINPSK